MGDGIDSAQQVELTKKQVAKSLRKGREKQLIMFAKSRGPRIGTPSVAWNFFDLVSSTAAKCLICDSLVTTTFSSTSGLLKHLKIRHLSYCEQWEKDNVRTFDVAILDTHESHPIRQHFNEMEKETWSCKYCDTVFLG